MAPVTSANVHLPSLHVASPWSQPLVFHSDNDTPDLKAEPRPDSQEASCIHTTRKLTILLGAWEGRSRVRTRIPSCLPSNPEAKSYSNNTHVLCSPHSYPPLLAYSWGLPRYPFVFLHGCERLRLFCRTCITTYPERILKRICMIKAICVAHFSF